MDVERALLSKALASGELPDVVARGIEADHFADDELADIYEWSTEFMAKHKQAPSMDVVRGEFGDFSPLLTKDPMTYHLDRFVRLVKERIAVELVRGYHDALEDPDEIDEIELRALEMARELNEVIPTPKAQRLSEGGARRQEYERRKKKNVKHGINIGIKTFDDITLGIQPHELLIWGGPPGGGKTTAIQYTALNAYVAGKTVLFVSLEVEAEQILRKFDTMLTHVRYRALKGLELDDGEEKEWHRILRQCEKDRAHKDIIIVDDIRNCTVDKVAAEQIRHKPGMVCVDYLEEMRTPRNVQGWEGVAANGRGLKQAARITKTPHVTATQLNREGETSYQSAQKIADMLIVLNPPEDDEDQTKMALLMRKYRDGPSRKPVMMHWDLDVMDIHELAGGSFTERPKLGNEKKKNPWTERHRNGDK
jgi:replicative DNA helicase